MCRNLAYAIAFLIGILATADIYCQNFEEGWKGIQPLKTNKPEVEKILGVGRIVEPRYVVYEGKFGFVRVTYTLDSCTDDGFKRGRFTVPRDTVLEYEVRLNERKKLSDLKIERSEFERIQRGDVANIFEYVNKRDGITITVYVYEDQEYVSSIEFTPKLKLIEEFVCEQRMNPC